MENKVIKNLTESELNRFGFVKKEFCYRNEKFPIKLVITDVEGSFLIDWDDIQLSGRGTPPPVKTNSDLLKVMVAIAPFVVRKMDHENVTNKEKIVSEAMYFASGLFLDIDGVRLFPNIDRDGRLTYIPGDANTLTLMLGEESHFIITMKNGNKFDLYTNISCMSYEGVFEMSGAYPKMVEIEVEKGKYESFFGIGCSFPKVKTNDGQSS